MALETEIKKLREAVEKNNELLSGSGPHIADAASDDSSAEDTTPAEDAPKKRGPGRPKKSESKKSEGKAKQTESKKSEASGDDAPDPQEVRNAFGAWLSEHEGEDRQVRKDAIRAMIDQCENEDGEKPKNASDICADHRAWALSEFERIKAEYDGGDSSSAEEDEDGDV